MGDNRVDREQAIDLVRTAFNKPLFVPCTTKRCKNIDCLAFEALLALPNGTRVVLDPTTGRVEVLPSEPAPALKFEADEVTGVQPNVRTESESILQEAHRLTHGDRRADYGHPLDDYTRTAALVSALLAHKLKESLTADEMALAMVCVKLSRQIHRPKRDNTVDGAGYFWVAQECRDEADRRSK